MEKKSRIVSPVVWQLLSFVLFFGLWEVAGRWPISFAFPPFSKTSVPEFDEKSEHEHDLEEESKRDYYQVDNDEQTERETHK